MKDFVSITRCFVNNKCSWKSCPTCINKQIKIDNESLDIVYDCPQCRKQSVFRNHTRFTRYIKGNRGALLYVYKLQHKYLDELSKRLLQINQNSNIWGNGTFINLTDQVIDIGGNIIPQDVLEEIDLSSIQLLPSSP
tara:strand:+ start:251 stop:661 length:411 start_codon:yes stop_codon:yes gene_type:complete